MHPFQQIGFIDKSELPKSDSIVRAYVERSNNHFYHREFAKAVEMADLAYSLNPELTYSILPARNIGQARTYVGDYEGALKDLTRAIKADTAGSVRIMNFVIPDFEYRAKSYLILKDTLKAIEDYETLASRFNEGFWGETGILYKRIGDHKNAERSFLKGAEAYKSIIGFSEKQNRMADMEHISLIELLILSGNFETALSYADSIKNKISRLDIIPIYIYLVTVSKFLTNKSAKIDLSFFDNLKVGQISRNWSYGLFLSWLELANINAGLKKEVQELTLKMQKMAAVN